MENRTSFNRVFNLKTHVIVKKYLVLNNDDNNYEFDIIVENVGKKTIYSLSTNNSYIWENHYKNKVILTITDDTDKLSFKTMSTMGYDDASYFMLLLNFIDHIEDTPSLKYKIVPFNEIIVI